MSSQAASSSCDDLAQRGRRILSGEPADQAGVLRLAQDLRDCSEFNLAAALFDLACSPDIPSPDPDRRVWIHQQLALCISKDRTRSADECYAEAMDVLKQIDLATTSNPETLGIAGGVAKRHWEVFRQRDRLDEARAYYERGWGAGGAADDGYTGINYAYLLNVSAHSEEAAAGHETSSSRRFRDEARSVRAAIAADRALVEKAAAVPAKRDGYWVLATLGEAHFGLALDDERHYEAAARFIARAAAMPDVPAWMLETTARQLSALARLQEVAPGGKTLAPAAWQIIDSLIGNRAPGLRTEVGGKVGLALSGGGFRASLFHIGVLARLAETGTLRHVEVLSCVSGGSIVGALYYLKLRDLLQRETDRAITNEDYVKLVQELEKEFLRAIQENNLRMRILESFSENLKLLQGDSRTERLSQLMDEVLYGGRGLSMQSLAIKPLDSEGAFHPREHNWGRKNKVPLLVLNATSLNTGHSWHFTPFEMGEPALGAATAADSNPAVPTKPYTCGVPLSRAVAASACVPALFEPLAFGGGIRLVDGGVSDNQGSSALLVHDCTILLVSDGSGQLADQAKTAGFFASVAIRADDIIQERLRIALFQGLEARTRSSLVRGVMFAHLKMGLRGANGITSYGLNPEAQRRIASIRTDLDVFHDAEALSLMFTGYQLARQSLPEALPGLVIPDSPQSVWRFLDAREALTGATPLSVLTLLGYSSKRFLKVWYVVPFLRRFGMFLLLGAACALLWALHAFWEASVTLQVGTVTLGLAGAMAGWLAAKYLGIKKPDWKEQAAKTGLALFGSGAALLHRRLLDPAYRKAGAVFPPAKRNAAGPH